MAHAAQQEYIETVKNQYKSYFIGKKVLDCGSLDINGSNRSFFEDCEYTGIDVGEGANVDIVSTIHEFDAANETYDVVICTETAEHDQYYPQSLANMMRMLKSGGLFIFSCATTGRKEHGTRRTSPHKCPLTQDIGDWGDYYKNLTEEDIREVLDIEGTFSEFKFESIIETPENKVSSDLRLHGVKR